MRVGLHSTDCEEVIDFPKPLLLFEEVCSHLSLLSLQLGTEVAVATMRLRSWRCAS
jgi:hypothetical protein